MKKKIHNYTVNADITRLMVADDNLPSPEECAQAEEVVIVSIPMSKKSVDFFKKSAKKADVPYTGMIRRLVDTYAEQCQQHT